MDSACQFGSPWTLDITSSGLEIYKYLLPRFYPILPRPLLRNFLCMLCALLFSLAEAREEFLSGFGVEVNFFDLGGYLSSFGVGAHGFLFLFLKEKERRIEVGCIAGV